MKKSYKFTLYILMILLPLSYFLLMLLKQKYKLVLIYEGWHPLIWILLVITIYIFPYKNRILQISIIILPASLIFFIWVLSSLSGYWTFDTVIPSPSHTYELLVHDNYTFTMDFTVFYIKKNLFFKKGPVASWGLDLKTAIRNGQTDIKWINEHCASITYLEYLRISPEKKAKHRITMILDLKTLKAKYFSSEECY